MQQQHTVRPGGVVSIHAPREGATRPAQLHWRVGCSFNPRAREGATRRRRHDGLRDEVSIHAPVRARRGVGVMMAYGMKFQSTRP
jgi:hypothetical protein